MPLQVIVRDVPNGDVSQARTIAELAIRDDQAGTAILGRMLIDRMDEDGSRHRYILFDPRVARMDVWSLIRHVSRLPSRRITLPRQKRGDAHRIIA